ncbi:MAG TPA: NAD-dependent epimerase/dehydratase family protein, partial [Candidatus Paceibacterota bacterium]|nr:NAD-dependent epimerase/dehydratase family protein [Candidatus Paceibacterota bacterium]
HYMSAEFAQKNGIDFIWARFFYVYGPGQKSHSLIPHLIERKRAGLPPDLKTPGAANDFVYVGDVARALAMILEKHKPSQSNTYNIGSGRLSAVKDVVNQIYKKSIVKAKKVPGFYADVSLIKKEIGWKPRTSLKAGIRATIGE